MNGHEFLRRTRILAKRQGVRWAFDTRQGRGSHGTLRFGDRKTTVPDRRKEIRPGLLAAMCRQLGIRKEDLE